MVVENAERFGLSAAAPAAGPGGPGIAAECWCVLMSSDNHSAEDVRERLRVLCEHRGRLRAWRRRIWRAARPRRLFSASRQHGLPTLQIADLMNDTRTLHAAQAEAVAMLADDPLLEAPEHALLEQQVQQMFEKAGAMN